MIRVLWIVPDGQAWLGGVNYYRNLLLALQCLPERQIEPIIACNSGKLPLPLSQCETFEWSAYSPRNTWKGFWQRVRCKIFKRSSSVTEKMQAQGILVLSHSMSRMLGKKSCFELCWIPDFQHIHLPHFFSEQECQARSANFAVIADQADKVIVSSEDVKKDFMTLFPEQEHKVRVLSFVAPPPDMAGAPEAGSVMARYEITEPYIHIPNQLWIHKNHKVAIEALGILKRETGNCPLIISTGHTEDYRHPDFFKQVQEMVGVEGVEDRFRFLGVVPYADLVVLMREAVCILNPSLFEGWSTTVEEAKSMGKKLILSDIPVHLEQNPDRGFYFTARDPRDLASKIEQVMGSYNPQEEHRAAEEARAHLPRRMAAYAKRYQDIVLEALEERRL